MTGDGDGDESGGGGGSRFDFLQPGRDPASNWNVDLSQKLEEYLLRIYSGEAAEEGGNGHFSVNFAEAALVVQGSVQVYGRKVEYLYSLVLHALEFLSQKSREENQQSGHCQKEADDNIINSEEENDLFFGFDDVAVEERNCLNDDSSNGHETSGYSIKPPANILVLEGDCLDTSGDAGELESYLLATCDLYEDFLLLDLSDAEAVWNYLKGLSSINENVVSMDIGRLKSRRGSMMSQRGQSAGKSVERSGKDKAHQTSGGNAKIVDNNVQFESSSNDPNLWESNLDYTGVGQDCGPSDYGGSFSDEDDDEDDPWKPLNPHEPGDLKVKPFKKVKPRTQIRCSNARNSILLEFPVATADRNIRPEFADVLKDYPSPSTSSQASGSPPLFEKLRRTLVAEEVKVVSDQISPKTSLNVDKIPDKDSPDLDDFCLEDDVDVNEDASLPHEKVYFDDVDFDGREAFGEEELNIQASLEDLCRAHLDDLLKNITETETQTEMAARVMTWKQGIEHALEEQEAHPPFDIHDYGKKILDKWSSEDNKGNQITFTEIVRGVPDYDVARTFSALLQLVNDRNLVLERGKSGGESVCYTCEKPFSVRLLSHKGRDIVIRSSKKRTKSASKKDNSEKFTQEMLSDEGLLSSSPTSKSLQAKGKLPLKFGKGNAIRCTPDGKRRRRSRLIDPIDLPSAR